MKTHTYLIIITLLIYNYCNAQVLAYPSINQSKVLGASCADLHFVNPIVIGHQLNVSVTYYETLLNAQNMSNPLDRFYEPLSNPQIIYARVDSNLNASFAIEESEINSAVPGGPPPGISPCYFEICDADNSGSEQVYLDNLRCKYDGYGFPNLTFCNSSDSEVQTTYYLSENDAINETNPINQVYSLTGSQTFYRKIKNITTNEFLIDDLLNVNLISCSIDSDLDGIADLTEDPNRNLLFDDDDTDLDGLKNYLDDDDDGDGILTINEDYNNNGDPTDDDTNSNGIADYLESDVTLSVLNNEYSTIKIYPNPVTEVLTIKSNIPIKSIKVFNSLDQMILFEENSIKLDMSKQQSGLYFIRILNANGLIEILKIVKN